MERFLNETLGTNLQMLMTWIYLMTSIDQMIFAEDIIAPVQND